MVVGWEVKVMIGGTAWAAWAGVGEMVQGWLVWCAGGGAVVQELAGGAGAVRNGELAGGAGAVGDIKRPPGR